MAHVALAANCRCTLGESPSWDAQTRTLWHVDISGKAVLGLRDGRALTPLALPEQVGCVLPRKGGLLACCETQILSVDVDKGVVGAAVLKLPSAPGFRCNDGKASPDGRLFVGTMHASWRDPSAPAGALFRLDRSQSSSPPILSSESTCAALGGACALAAASLLVGRARGRSTLALAAGAALAAGLAGSALSLEGVVAASPAASYSLTPVVSDARLPNGLTWSADGRTLYWTDSFTQNVDAFDYDSSGGLSNRRTVVRCPRQGAGSADAIGGVPDGLTIDCAGHLWVVLGESGHVVQYDAATGKQIAAVALPVQRPTACTWGGADLSELYVTTRAEGEGGSSLAGGLFRVHVPGSRGLHAAYAWAG